ncbi:MAG: 30S ribosomal protein S17 [Planctomycetaceae bacterium]
MRKKLIGVVVSDKRDKTRRVDVSRLFSHPTYGKIVRGRTVCQVHDEQNETHLGDTVEIIECPPKSKTKRGEVLRIVKASTDVAREARKLSETDEPQAETANS